MSLNNKERGVLISTPEWADLRDVYKQDWPKNAYSFNVLENYIQLAQKDPKLCKRGVRIWSIDNNWREHGIYILDDQTGDAYIIRVDAYFNECSELFQTALSYLDLVSCDEVIFREKTAKNVTQFLEGQGYSLKNKCYPAQLYHLSKESSLQLQLREHTDYIIKPLTLAEVEEVESVWLYKRKGTGHVLERNIKHNLSFGAYNRHIGELCAWVLINELGVIGFLYVKDNYRRQGLAEYLVTHLCHVLAKQGCDAAAHIVDGNTPSLKLFKRLGFEAIEYDYWFLKEEL
ncbi:PREDICTED: uncharacterized protein LOC108971502 [Bactrocera latifrons]|uniref:uncharacterized protein LOC108971502 n=1 Tax=Bactrocera latifrons TaxID=174628 RepID=UPI0008DE7422|nr:PREDICTED: uncharacterized protein LOC108971502 [Bactrocera latifrons]